MRMIFAQRLLVVSLLLAILAIHASAYDYTDGNNVNYTIIGGEAYVDSSPEAYDDIRIPESIEISGNNYNVVGIKEAAFRSTSIRNIYIEAPLLSIGERAFMDARNLYSVDFSSQAPVHIGASAFERCLELVRVSWPSSSSPETIYESAFYRCYNLQVIGSLSSTLEIGHHAFRGTNLLECDLTNIESIGMCAFMECRQLCEITLGDRLREIGINAFLDCIGMRNVYCNADPKVLTWEGNDNGFMYAKATLMHVKADDLDTWRTKFSTLNVTLTGTATLNSAEDAYWGSYYASNTVVADAATTVYTAKLTGEAIELVEVEDRIISAGSAVILKRTTNNGATLTETTSAATDTYYADNALQGSSSSTSQDGLSAYYVLSNKSAGVGFYLLNSSIAIPPHRAYIKVTAGAPAFYGFSDATDRATAIDTLPRAVGEDDNSNRQVFDLQGRRITRPTRGLYIVGGMKRLVK